MSNLLPRLNLANANEELESMKRRTGYPCHYHVDGDGSTVTLVVERPCGRLLPLRGYAL